MKEPDRGVPSILLQCLAAHGFDLFDRQVPVLDRAVLGRAARSGTEAGSSVGSVDHESHPIHTNWSATRIARRSVVDLQCMAVFRKVPEGYIAFIEEFPGANTQGASLEEARTNLREAVALVIEANREMAREDADGSVVIREPITFTA